jgi:prostaglandin-endoperoxide synthase 2
MAEYLNSNMCWVVVICSTIITFCVVILRFWESIRATCRLFQAIVLQVPRVLWMIILQKLRTLHDAVINFISKVFEYLLTSPEMKDFWYTVQKGRKMPVLNYFLIREAIHAVKRTPYSPLTPSDYVSWDLLTNYSHSRYLPPAKPAEFLLPTSQQVVKELFLPQMPGDRVESQTSSLLFAYMAQWVTEGVFRTVRINDMTDITRTLANHQLDLSLVYGWNPAMTNALRSYQGGRLKSQQIKSESGLEEEYPEYYFHQDQHAPHLLHKEEFHALDMADLRHQSLQKVPHEHQRMLFALGGNRVNFQMGTLMLNVLFLREHNRICKDLAEHYPTWDDERLFQTARNILTVLFIKIVLEEYINHIIPWHFKLSLDPITFHRFNPSQQGYSNRLTIEFNLLYRLHSMVPDHINYAGKEEPLEKMQWQTQLVSNRGLGVLFDEASNQPAMKIQLWNTPKFLRGAEINSIEQARRVRLTSYNEYRKICGLPVARSFDQINPSEKVQRRLEELYQHPDNVEFYVGLFAEPPRKGSPFPPLLARLVAVEAFTKIMTNPLLGKDVFRPETFSEYGWNLIHTTQSLAKVLHRNIPPNPSKRFDVSFRKRQ